MKNWHHRQIIIEETQELSLVRQGRWDMLMPEDCWGVYHEVGSFPPCAVSSNIWFIPAGSYQQVHTNRVTTRQTKPQRKQCTFFLRPDFPPGSQPTRSSTSPQLPLAMFSSSIRRGEQSCQQLGDFLHIEWGIGLWQSWGVRVFLPLLYSPLSPSLMALFVAVPGLGCPSLEGSYLSLTNQPSFRAKQGEVGRQGLHFCQEDRFCLRSGSWPQGLFT